MEKIYLEKACRSCPGGSFERLDAVPVCSQLPGQISSWHCFHLPTQDVERERERISSDYLPKPVYKHRDFLLQGGGRWTKNWILRLVIGMWIFKMKIQRCGGRSEN